MTDVLAAPTESPATSEENTTLPGGVSYEDLVSSASGDDAAQNGWGDNGEASKEAATEKNAPLKEDGSGDETAGEDKKPEVKKSEAPQKGKEKDNFFLAKTSDGKTLKVPKDAKFLKTVEGKEREVSVDEALKAFAFDVNYQKKYEEVSALKKEATELKEQATTEQRKAVETLQLVGSALRETGEALSKKDVAGFIDKFSDMTQLSKLEVTSILRGHFLESAKDYLEADETQRKILDKDEENQFLRDKQTKDAARASRQERLRTCGNFAHQQAIKAGIEGGITSETWKKAEARVIKDYLNGHHPDFSDASQVTDYQLREYVASVIDLVREEKLDTNLNQLIEEASPGLEKSNKELYDEVRETIAPFLDKLSKEKIAEVVKKAVSQSSEEDDDVEILDDKAKARQNQSSTSRVDTGDTDDNPLSVYN